MSNLMWKDSGKLQNAVDSYFSNCGIKPLEGKDGDIVYNKSGEPVLIENPPTRAGLTLSLGFKSKQSLSDYRDRDFGDSRANRVFADIINEAFLKIEEYVEKKVIIEGKGGQIFWLKNVGWTDTQQVQHDGGINIKVEYV